MPNERHRRRTTRRVEPSASKRIVPVFLLGLVAAALLGRTPPSDGPVRWTVRDAEAWMADFDALREARLASGPTMRLTDPAPAPVAAVASERPTVVAAADLPPRDVPKTVPLGVDEPEITGAVPGARRPDTRSQPQAQPVINRTGKGDRLFSPQPFGRTTDRDLLVKPTLATVPPTLEGWPPLMAVASLTAPLTAATMPRLALAAPPKNEAGDRVVVAMVRSGPGRVVTQSAIAALGTSTSPALKGRSRVVLPPVPEQVAAGPRTKVWDAPSVPEIGFARRATDVLDRFRAVLGDEDEAPAATPQPQNPSDDQLPP